MNEDKNRLQAIDDELVQAASLVHRRTRPRLKRRVVDEGLAALLDSEDGRLPQESSPVASVERKLAR
ncbi:hypothetical protein ACFOPQ_09600 [Deinococcus antarcticus]|uniref:DUF2191 domain-containing protein n=1 Tax=Deinococcus antarcticus TaxID=1298767 RepID=A0ABV8A6N1_9DEIO